MDTDIPPVEEIYNLFMDSPMNASFEVTSGGVQEPIQPKYWRQFFDDVIKSEPWHYSATKTTPHKESLYQHLVDTGRICYEEAIRMQVNIY